MFFRLAAVFLLSGLLLPALARAGDDPNKPLLAIVPPTLRPDQAVPGEDAQEAPEQIMTQVASRMTADRKGEQWPFRLLPVNTIPDLLKAAGGYKNTRPDVAFSDLKQLAERARCRFLMLIRVKERTASFQRDLLTDTARARASVEITLYDHETDTFVWKGMGMQQTSHPKGLSEGGLRREADGALAAALMTALEPLAKGKRSSVPRAKANIVASVSRVLRGGNRVLLDVGRGQKVMAGDVFRSVESDCEVRITEVLENGSIARVVAGTPKEREVFKSKR